MIGALEAGGTKFVCAVFRENGELVNRISIPTKTPNETIPKVIEYFKGYPEIKAIGIGSFGPIGTNTDKSDYGYITNTPKIPWQKYNLLGVFEQTFPEISISWTTDVNVAAYGEMKKGAGADVNNSVYITVGTGVGAGIIVDGKFLDGYNHPEVGHMTVRKHKNDSYKGSCPFHEDCLEGLVCGPAIEERWNDKAINLADNAVVWGLEAFYLAQAIYDLYLSLSPERIILGGGVMKQKQLFPLIRKELEEINKGYVTFPPLDSFVVSPVLEDDAGIIGCFELAKDELEEKLVIDKIL